MDDVAIKVDRVSKTFKLPHEKSTSIKGALINRFKGGNRGYERQVALSDISFEIKKGDFFGIVGRNGSGKSTLLKMLAGTYTPTEGGIQVNGKLTPFIELGVGFNPELTGRENVFLNGALLGFSRKEMSAMYNDIVAFAELEKFMDQKLKNYSSGMQVRLAFSIAVRAQTDILLLDEVLAVGDAAFQQKCFNYFEELKQQHKTVVFVSHDMDAVRRFCNRAAYIKNSKLIHVGAPAEVADIYLEENMKSIQRAEKQDGAANALHSLDVKITKQTNSEIIVRFDYKSSEAIDMYLGISILRNGIAVAEMNTTQHKPLVKSGHAIYRLDTTQLNGGMYGVGSGLFRTGNGELLAIGSSQVPFIIKGEDSSRGGAIKLSDNWKYE